jgi:hypothetical protein
MTDRSEQMTAMVFSGAWPSGLSRFMRRSNAPTPAIGRATFAKRHQSEDVGFPMTIDRFSVRPPVLGTSQAFGGVGQEALDGNLVGDLAGQSFARAACSTYLRSIPHPPASCFFPRMLWNCLMECEVGHALYSTAGSQLARGLQSETVGSIKMSRL